MLNNLVFILHLADCFGVWIILPLCDLNYLYVISVYALWAVLDSRYEYLSYVMLLFSFSVVCSTVTP
jgi:hypothetical protein